MKLRVVEFFIFCLIVFSYCVYAEQFQIRIIANLGDSDCEIECDPYYDDPLFVVDGVGIYYSPFSFNWESGSVHTISANLGPFILHSWTAWPTHCSWERILFKRWQHTTLQTFQFIVPNSNSELIAEYNIQYHLVEQKGIDDVGGSVVLSGNQVEPGYFPVGSTATLTAVPDLDYEFDHWEAGFKSYLYNEFGNDYEEYQNPITRSEGGWYRAIFKEKSVNHQQKVSIIVRPELDPISTSWCFPDKEESMIELDGQGYCIPIELYMIAGTTHTIVASQEPFLLDYGFNYEKERLVFDHWEHTDQEHFTFTVPDEDVVFAAVYRKQHQIYLIPPDDGYGYVTKTGPATADGWYEESSTINITATQRVNEMVFHHWIGGTKSREDDEFQDELIEYRYQNPLSWNFGGGWLHPVYIYSECNVSVSGFVEIANTGPLGSGFPVPNVTITYEEEMGSTVTSADGGFSKLVPCGWYGNLVPYHPAYMFDPPKRSINNVQSDIDEQFFIAYPKTISLAVSSTNLIIGSSSGSTGTFNITANVTWNVTDEAEWLSINPNVGSNDGTITVKALSANISINPRSATVNVQGGGITKTVVVTQDGIGNINKVILVKSNNYQFAYIKIGMEYYIDRTFTVSEIPVSLQNLLWLKTANDDQFNVSADMLIFQLNQAAKIYVGFDPRAAIIPAWLKDNFSPTDLRIRVSDKAASLIVWEKICQAGTHTLGGNFASGSGDVTAISNYVLLFDFSIIAPSLTVSPTSVNIGSSSGSSGTFDITSNVSWTVSDDASWLTVSPTSGSNKGTVTVTASSANTSTSSRNATVTLSGGGITRTVTIIQSGSSLPQTLSLSLSSGWNLVSFPLIMNSSAVLNVLSPLGASWSKLMSYQNNSWQQADASISSNFWTLTTITSYSGYWLYQKSNQTLNLSGQIQPVTIQLVGGWNLIGYPASSSQTVSNVISGLSGKWKKLLHFKNNNWYQADASLSSSFWTLTQMTPGNGHWLEMNSSANISFSTNGLLSINESTDHQDNPDLANNEYFTEKANGLYYPPELPCGLYGYVNLPDGMESKSLRIVAKISGCEQRFTSNINPEGNYGIISIGKDDLATQAKEGADIGEIIELFIEYENQLIPTHQSVTWEAGVNKEVKLAFGQQELLGNEGKLNKFGLVGNYPNPFNPTTEIEYSVDRSAEVNIGIYNLIGQKIRTLFNGTIGTGIHHVSWNSLDDWGQSCPAGIYVCVMISGDRKDTKKILLVR